MLLLLSVAPGPASARLASCSQGGTSWIRLWRDVQNKLVLLGRRERAGWVKAIHEEVVPNLLLDIAWIFETNLQKETQPMRLEMDPPSRQVLAPVPWAGTEPPFVIARDGGFFGMDLLHPTELVHMASIGGTGVGKTQSTIVPLMRAMVRYELEHNHLAYRSAMLIVDPKCELLPIVQRELRQVHRSDDLIVLGVQGLSTPVAFFEPNDHLSVADKMDRLDAVLNTATLAQGDHVYWHTAAVNVLTQILNLEGAYLAKAGVSLVGELCKYHGMELLDGFWNNLSRLLEKSRQGKPDLAKIHEHTLVLLDFASLDAHPCAGVFGNFLVDGDSYTQWHYRLQALHPMILLLGDRQIASVIDFNPFPSASTPRLKVREAIDEGRILLFQPEELPSSELAARAIKIKVYDAVKTRSRMHRPVGIVIDEFQKFITCDNVTGDAHFLDTARAYRVNCVMATQSVGALLLALGNDQKARSAVDAIVANTPSKWFFASKDSLTRETVRALIPSHPDRPHITDVRTLAQRKPGEAYWSLADGRWGLGRAYTERFM